MVFQSVFLNYKRKISFRARHGSILHQQQHVVELLFMGWVAQRLYNPMISGKGRVQISSYLTKIIPIFLFREKNVYDQFIWLPYHKHYAILVFYYS